MTKIFGLRMSIIGDTIMALPILDHLEEVFGEYEMIFIIAKKCKQAKPLYLNQKNITHIKISDLDEDLGPEDLKLAAECDLVINPKPTHPFILEEADWYNHRHCVDETALMAGINPDSMKSKTPKLEQYWEDPHSFNRKTICIWPFAGYGGAVMAGFERSPTKEWWGRLIKRLIKEGYDICHFGVECEPDLSKSDKYKKFTNLSLFEQVQTSLCCDLAIGTDSGSMWVLGAYHKIPQINLLTNWQVNHHSNPFAFGPVSSNGINLFASGGCDNIPQEKVLEHFENLI
jgi:ADP-heptose:LPS heptosyltransferase